jgi:hypothetical protein
MKTQFFHFPNMHGLCLSERKRNYNKGNAKEKNAFEFMQQYN